MSAPTLSDLKSKKCVPCEGDVPPLSAGEVEVFLDAVEGWSLTNQGQRVRREWVARNFMAGIAFFDKVAALAEDEGHHPDLHLVGYHNVAVEIYTHAVGGLTENDFILAAKINEIPIEIRRHH